MKIAMRNAMFFVLLVLGSIAMAAEDEATLKAQMAKDCASLFAAGGECSDLAKGTRKCVRQNVTKGSAECVAFEKQHAAFFDAGMNDPIIKK